jgi:phosphoribosylglycinamide formyltransferase-1
VETSGQFLKVDGARVIAKDWLLDPFNITIGGPTTTAGASGLPNYTPQMSSNISVVDIQTNLNAGTSVKISTGLAGSNGTQDGNIDVNASIEKTSGNAATLTLEANNRINLANGVKIINMSLGGDGRLGSAFEAALLEPILAARPDILCLAGFMRVLTPAFVDRFAGRMLNIHPSLLPKYPGLHTHQRALDAGDSEAGCTVHEVTPVLDDGPILGQARVPVLAGDTADTLAARVLEQEHRLYPAVLRRFAAGERGPLYLS